MTGHTTHHRQLTCLDLADPFGWGRRRSVDRELTGVGVGRSPRATASFDPPHWPSRPVPPGWR